MRIWDLSPRRLCRVHLLGEHCELHAIWEILTRGKKGYSRHPETLRWHGRTRALYQVHEKIVREMSRRGYRHLSPLKRREGVGPLRQDRRIDSRNTQILKLGSKGCSCRV